MDVLDLSGSRIAYDDNRPRRHRHRPACPLHARPGRRAWPLAVLTPRLVVAGYRVVVPSASAANGGSSVGWRDHPYPAEAIAPGHRPGHRGAAAPRRHDHLPVAPAVGQILPLTLPDRSPADLRKYARALRASLAGSGRMAVPRAMIAAPKAASDGTVVMEKAHGAA
jgi:hypothetical protein